MYSRRFNGFGAILDLMLDCCCPHLSWWSFVVARMDFRSFCATLPFFVAAMFLRLLWYSVSVLMMCMSLCCSARSHLTFLNAGSCVLMNVWNGVFFACFVVSFGDGHLRPVCAAA